METQELPKTKEQQKKIKPKIRTEKQQIMFMKYFKAGVTSISENGKDFPLVTEEWPLMIQQEIGGIVMTRGTLGDEEKKS